MSAFVISPPERLSPRFDVSTFDCGEAALDEWLKKRALANEAAGASRTYVVGAGSRVAGYYSLAVGAVAHAAAPGRIKRNMPDPVPVMILGRLAVDKAFQRRGIGVGLLRDAVLRTAQAGEIAGIRAILIHAISEPARRFYEAFGFVASPIDPMTVMMSLPDALKTLSSL
jgi:GNAT superfamily N-acetyltransferase